MSKTVSQGQELRPEGGGANGHESNLRDAANCKYPPDNGTNGKGIRSGSHSPSSVEFPVVEPWPEAVDGAQLLDELMSELQRFVVLPKWAAETFALWVLHTYAFLLRDVTTYLGIESPERECGKSTLVTLLSQLVNRPAVSSNISSSAFFRAIEELQPTLLIDEADTNLRGKDDLSGILNAGYTKPTAFVWRICYDAAPGVEGSETERAAGSGSSAGRVARYSCWCPKAIAAIGHLHPTLASRCILVRMQRKTAEEECQRLKRLNAMELQRKCVRFVADHAREIASAEPQIPAGLKNRAADIWEPLLALADLAGGRWPELARVAATGLTARAQENSPIGSLLMDIYMVFLLGGVERVFSRELVAGLVGLADRPWAELRKGRQVTETWLAQQLRPFGVKPRTMRINGQLGKGYAQEELIETFRRYIPRATVEEAKAELRALSAENEAKNEGGSAKTEGEA